MQQKNFTEHVVPCCTKCTIAISTTVGIFRFDVGKDLSGEPNGHLKKFRRTMFVFYFKLADEVAAPLEGLNVDISSE